MGRAQTVSPVTTGERIQVIDILRGFALCGIFLFNINSFAVPNQLHNISEGVAPIDQVVNSLLLLFVESKFFTLFSFLYGLGFAIQIMRAEARQQPFTPLYLRRIVVLAIFGILHIALLWEGDILLLYAVVGLVLLLFQRATPQTLQRWVIVLLGIALGLSVMALVGTFAARMTGSIDMVMLQERYLAILEGGSGPVKLLYQHESFWGYLNYRLLAYRSVIIVNASRTIPVLAMFLLGLLVGRFEILRAPGEHDLLLRRVRFWGLLLGTSVSLFVTIANSTFPPIEAVAALSFNQYFSGPLQSMGMAAALVLLVQDARWARRLQPLAAYGRMSLTNYLGQTLLAVLFFYVFGLVNQVNLAVAMLIVIGLCILQIGFSNWWLRSYRFGPLEWVWRSLTYGSPQPLRK